MKRKFIQLLYVSLSVIFYSCADNADDHNNTDKTYDSCENNECHEHEFCAVIDQKAQCFCNEGFYKKDDACILGEKIETCLPELCTEPHKTVCAILDGSPTCLCDDGYIRNENDICILIDSDPCLKNPCDNEHQYCENDNGVSNCKCVDEYNDMNGICTKSSTTTTDNPCEPNPCDEKNRNGCTIDENNNPICLCNEGYIDKDDICIADAQTKCNETSCAEPNRTKCVDKDNEIQCVCDDGYIDVNGLCIQPESCDPNPCIEANKTTCQIHPATQKAACACDIGFEFDNDGITCKQINPCEPINPCVEPNKTECISSQHSYTCQCIIGYEEEVNGNCVIIPSPTCASQHTSGDSFEPDECPALATPISVGVTHIGNTIDPAGDQDWFSFSATTDRIYKVNLQHSNNVTSTIQYLYMTIYKPDGTTILDTNYYSSPSVSLVNKYTLAGTYYIKVRNAYSVFGNSYTITITDLGTDDHSDTFTNPTPISNNTASGTFEYSDDADFFSFSATTDRIYKVNLQHSNNVTSTIEYLYMTIYKPDGTTILDTNYYSSPSVSLVNKYTLAETYYIKVRNAYSVFGNSYTITITDLGTDDHSDTFTNSTPISNNTESGTFEYSGDTDFFSFTATADRIYKVNNVTSTIQYLYMTIYKPDGTTILDTNYYSSPSVSLVNKYTLAGTYYIKVRNAYSVFGDSYTITITDLGVDDHSDGPVNATTITVNGNKESGVLAPVSDIDWFTFTTPSTPSGAGTASFEIGSSGISLLKEIYKQDGATLVFTLTSNISNVSLNTSATYFIKVTTNNSSYGNYQIWVKE